MFKKKSDMVHLLVVNSRPESNPETGAPWQSIVPEIWSGLLAETQALSSVSDTESPASTKEPSKTQKSALQTSSTPLTSDLPPVPFTNNQGTASQDTDDTLSSLRPFLGSRLTQSDFTQIDSFLTAFLVPRVIEVMIRCVRDWERDIASNRRGISARLLKVGLKYFGTTQKAGTGPVSPTMDSNGLVMCVVCFVVMNNTNSRRNMNNRLSHDSPDFLMRKLADYAFMLRDYKFSLSTYETLKKDFQNSESHIKYLAGAQVCLLSLF